VIQRRNIKENHRPTFLITDLQASAIADKIIGIVPVKCELVSVKEVHGTAGNDGSAVTASIERLQGTETSGNGDQVVNATINLKGTADTVQTGTIVETGNIHIFAAGDRVGFNLGGNSATLATMIIACEFRPVD
jgi:hypothetical protein